MFIARPAAEIEPQALMFSSSCILPGPIRFRVPRSMRRLKDGSDLGEALGMIVPPFHSIITTTPFALARYSTWKASGTMTGAFLLCLILSPLQPASNIARAMTANTRMR